MTIIVQCDCGRTLRAPDQMAGKSAKCVCGNSVPLLKETGPRKFEALEADLGDPDEGVLEAPILLRPREKKPKKKRSREDDSPENAKKSVFRPSQGRHVEPGEDDGQPTSAPLAAPRQRKKRRKDKVTSNERKRQRSETFGAGVGRSLKFPFRTESLLTIGIMASAYGAFTSVAGFLPYGVLGLKAMVVMFLGTMMILGYFGFFLLQIFRLASVDEDDLPLTLEFDTSLIWQDLWIWGGTISFCAMPFGAYWWGMARLTRWGVIDPGGMIPLVSLGVFGFCLFLFPMALMSAALHLSILDANPWIVVRSILRVPLEYVATISIFGALCGAMVAIGVFLPAYPPVIPILSHIVTWVFLFYALTASAYGFGNFYYRNRRQIDWFGELPRQI